MSRWDDAGADPLADLRAVHAHLGRGLSMAEATRLVLHPADAALLAPGRAVDPRLLALAGAALTGQPSDCRGGGVLDDLVARWRGSWFAADPFAATGEVTLQAVAGDLVRSLREVLAQGGVPGVPQRAATKPPGGVPPYVGGTPGTPPDLRRRRTARHTHEARP